LRGVPDRVESVACKIEAKKPTFNWRHLQHGFTDGDDLSCHCLRCPVSADIRRLAGHFEKVLAWA
jgi:hypothetical protein